MSAILFMTGCAAVFSIGKLIYDMGSPAPHPYRVSMLGVTILGAHETTPPNPSHERPVIVPASCGMALRAFNAADFIGAIRAT